MAVVIARQKGLKAKSNPALEFNIVELSDFMGWESGPVKRELKLLQWISGIYRFFCQNIYKYLTLTTATLCTSFSFIKRLFHLSLVNLTHSVPSQGNTILNS